MKLKVEIPKIRCKRTTKEIANDQIYFGVYVGAVKSFGSQLFPAGSDRGLFASVSEVKEEVTEGAIWCPELHCFEIQIKDAEVFGVSVVLYEYEDVFLYEKLVSRAKGFVSPDDFNYDFSQAIIVPAGTRVWHSKAVGVLDLLNSFVKSLGKDDMIGQKQVFCNVNEVKPFPRELKIEGQRGKYEVSMILSLDREDTVRNKLNVEQQHYLNN
ncbi:MAG: hypothetical protein ACEPOZ_14925 [Marinifilaceae bacterium]